MTEKKLADTRPTKEYLVNGITQDVTVEECIFDLIDNSIDAFPDHSSEIVCDYKDYIIELKLQKNFFSIKDNGKGIDRKLLETDTLRFGTKTEHHSTSIGYYGIGLNRAIFKLGKKINISTETNIERSIINLDISKFLKDNDQWLLPIDIEELKGTQGTLIEIQDLNNDVNKCFTDSEWTKIFQKELSLRYSEFLNKNLIIKINNETIKTPNISTRITSGFKSIKKDFIHRDVKVSIVIGQSSKHFFTYEKSYVKEDNATLKESGWFVYCNDRAVRLFDLTADTGWDSKPHSEHAGFIGKVYFVGNAGELPWNTSKTDVDLNNEVYKKALETMKIFSASWRTHTYKVHKKNYRPTTLENPLINDLFGSPLQQGQQHQVPLGPQQGQQHQVPLDPQQGQQHQDPLDLPQPKPLDQLDPQPEPLDQLDPPPEPLVQPDQKHTESEDNESGNFYEYDPNYTAPNHISDYEYLFCIKNAKIPFFIPEQEVKLRSLLAELIKIKITALPISTLMLIRAFIELSCDYYSVKFKVDIKSRKPSLAEIVIRCLNKMEEKQHLKLDTRRVSTLYSLCNEKKFEKSFLSIQNLQITIHSEDLIWDKSAILSFWYAILPFLTACYNSSQK